MGILSEIALTIDTREQNRGRIKAVEDWALEHGAIVEYRKLELCDYSLMGTFRDTPINLGIEAKSLADYLTSSDLEDKLARSYEIYESVGLFIEVGNYEFKVDTSGNAFIEIGNGNPHNEPFIRKPLEFLEDAPEHFHPVYVRQLRSEYQFPYTIYSLLKYIVKPIHPGLHIADDKTYPNGYLNILGKIPGIGWIKAHKLIKNYPNLKWLCLAAEPSLQEVIGKSAGTKAYNFIHNHKLETKEWREGYTKDGLKIIQEASKLVMEADEKIQSLDSKNQTQPAEVNADTPIPKLKLGIHDNAQESDSPPVPGHSNSHTGMVSTPLITQPDDQDKDKFSNLEHPNPIPCPVPMQETKLNKKKDIPQSSSLHKSPLSPAANSSEENRLNPVSKLNLEDTLYKYYKDPHTLEEAIEIHPWSSESIFTKTMSMKNRGLIRLHEQGNKRYYVRALQPDENKDVGV